MTCTMTPHALRRAQQRAACIDAIDAAIDYGTCYRQKGRIAYFLGRRAVEDAAKRGIDLGSFEGLAVIVAEDGAIVTVIKTTETKKLRSIRRKVA